MVSLRKTAKYNKDVALLTILTAGLLFVIRSMIIAKLGD